MSKDVIGRITKTFPHHMDNEMIWDKMKEEVLLEVANALIAHNFLDVSYSMLEDGNSSMSTYQVTIYSRNSHD